ncbi:Molybdopterin oxidoreductase, iron sulfur subunit [hydrothermal vent metagenome]|uniref:Molybdopterin oxidoreductase, iron sulfur subunit n=1 Tax=hydrothermal vent metagenome TaxID=652676 RepID=A0A3B1D1I0_9ZZZZ
MDTINQYLKNQADMTAVEKFSHEHDTLLQDDTQRRYSELIPKKSPGQGQQYAFEVDLDKCTGCKGCVTACHNENGLEEDEIWRTVGLLQGGSSQEPAIQHVTGACHHCIEPACMQGCPVKAYEKLPESGVVKHLDDQCIGCQYCILKCPYDVPKYNKKKGIVHKCDMCIGRLEVGEAPACVRGCPNEAIKITIISTENAIASSKDYVMNLPDAPDSEYTFPTTKYKTNKKMPWNMASADYFSVQPEHSHMPLVVMLVLTQLSVGAFGAILLLQKTIDVTLGDLLLPFHALIALGTGMLALNASIFHLGRPQYAFRAIIGLMTSWLSREILAFGAFSMLATIYALCVWPNPIGSILTNILNNMLPFGRALNFIEEAVVISGVFGIFCSVMVYKDTRRPFWNHPATTVKFLLTAGITGFATILLASVLFALVHAEVSLPYVMKSFGQTFCMIISIMASIKLVIEGSIFFHLNDQDFTLFKKTAILMTQPLKKATIWRFICGFIGGVIFPLILMKTYMHIGVGEMVLLSGFIFILTLIGEFLERYLFFKAVVPLK